LLLQLVRWSDQVAAAFDQGRELAHGRRERLPIGELVAVRAHEIRQPIAVRFVVLGAGDDEGLAVALERAGLTG